MRFSARAPFPHRDQRGNALFLILIAVALFAALSYAITKSGRSSGGSVTKEQEGLAEDQIVQYVGDLQLAVTRLQLSGCTDVTLDFSNSHYAFPSTNTNAPGNGSCNLYTSNGGGVVWQTPPAITLPLYDTCCLPALYVVGGDWGVAGAGLATEPDIMVNAYVTKSMCMDINNREGINSGNPPWSGGVDIRTDFHFISGGTPNTYAWEDGIQAFNTLGTASNSTLFANHMMGCADGNNGHYVFYAVLLAR